MKKLTTILLVLVVVCQGFAQVRQNLSDSISLKAVAHKAYRDCPKGTPIIIQQVCKLRGDYSQVTVVAEIDGKRRGIPIDQMDAFTLMPQNNVEFWQAVYIRNNMYDYFDKKGYRYELREELDNESLDYLDELSKIAYEDSYIVDYIQSRFAKFSPGMLDSNRPERLNARVIQSPNPDIYMLPNGSLLVSTGLLSALDSDEELAALMANEIAHYVLDHQVINVVKAENRAQRAAFWGSVLAGVAEGAADVAWYDNNDKAAIVSLAATIGSVAALVNVRAVDRLGMNYAVKQDIATDQVVQEFLTINGLNSDALASAIGKIKRFYEDQHRYNNLVRYGSCDNLTERLSKLNSDANLKSHAYQKAMSDVVTLTAAMYQNDQRYRTAEVLTAKNINNGVASEHDYVIFVQAKMAKENTPQSNEECMKLIEKAKSMCAVPNLDVYKQEILLLMRQNKQAKAYEVLQDYMELLAQYREQPGGEAEEKWIARESGWAQSMLAKISIL